MTNSAPGFENHPNHSVVIKPFDAPIAVIVDGDEIARSENAKLLQEASYPSVYYIPLEEIPAKLITKSDHKTYCPFKGTATYWDLTTDNGLKENSVWSYQEPYNEALIIKDHVAFYADAAIIKPLGE